MFCLHLTHHRDTVDTDDYGSNQNLAYEPYKLSEEYLKGNIDLDVDSKRDLESGNGYLVEGLQI